MSESTGENEQEWQSLLSSCLPPEVASMVTTAVDALEALASVGTTPLSGDGVRALGLTWQRLSTLAGAGRMAVLAAIEARDDVVPRTRGSQASAFGQHALGLSRGQARRDARDAKLLSSSDADLREVGHAYAEGAVTQAHVDIATRTHRDLGAEARDAVVTSGDLAAIIAELGVSAGADAGTDALDALLAVAEGGGVVRQVQVVDAVLAHHARRLSVPEFDAVARRIVHHLNPPNDRRAHEQRFLHLSPNFDGTWVGKFSCGAAQGSLLKAALKALAAPRPGITIDPDGVRRVLPDDRDLGARQMDALMELIAAALAAHGSSTSAANSADASAAEHAGTAHGESPAANTDTTSAVATPANAASTSDLDPSSPTVSDSSRTGPTTGPPTGPTAGPTAGAESAPTGDPSGAPTGEQSRDDEPPASEGEYTVVRPAEVLAAPFPGVDLVLVVGVEHVAAARAQRQCGDPFDLPQGGPLDGAGGDPPGDPPDHRPDRSPLASALGSFRRTAAPPGLGAAGQIDDNTMAMLACSASLRAVVLAPDGGVLNLGRSQRLATPAQRRALRARDGGCIVPGCAVPAEGCHAHHVISWEDGGRTDLDNLALACSRHHTEIHHGTWHIEMINGVPWIRPPTWVDRSRPLLRNAVHNSTTNRGEAGTGL